MRTKNNLIIGAAVFFAASMVVFPEVTQAGSKTAMSIWVNSIVPVLLPFFIFSDFIKRTGNLEKLPHEIYPFVIAFLSGYPMGAKIVGDMIIEGNISLTEGKRILSYSLITGPAFLIGVVGTLIGSSKGAVIITAAHYAGAFLNGAVFSFLKHPSSEESPVYKNHISRQQSLAELFSSSIIAAFRAMAVILAYLMIFMIGIYMLESVGAFDLLPGEEWSSSAKGIFEMTAGISMLGMCSADLEFRCVAAAFLTSFGGMSVIGQSVSMAQGSGLTAGDIIRIKIFHGLWAGLAAWFLCLFI